MKIVIKNGRVMDPASGRDEVTNIWVEDEKIIGFGEHPEWAEEVERLNAEGCVVAPGLVRRDVLQRHLESVAAPVGVDNRYPAAPVAPRC